MSLTYTQRVELLESDRVETSLRVEVLNEADEVVDEIDVDTCVIRHDSNASVHRSIELVTRAKLAWQMQRVRPWVTVSNGDLSEEVMMGTFVLTHPTPDSDLPPTYSVTGYDKLYLLDQKLVAAVSQPTGQPILFAVRTVLNSYGGIRDRIDTSRSSDTLSEPKVWPVEFDGTALDVINDLLSSVGYRPLFMDVDGFAYSTPSTPIDQRAVSWRYDAQAASSIVDDEGRSLDEDYTDAPNYWLFWSADVVRETPPVVNDGLYAVRNDTVGPASIQARGGVLVRSDNDGPIEAATQDDLVANGDRIVAEEIHSVVTYNWSTTINPFHGHDEAIEIIDRDFGVAGRFRHLSWELDVIEERMTHSASAIFGGVS